MKMLAIFEVLTDSEVSVYRGVSSGTCEVLTITVRNVLSSFGVSKALGETEIDDVNVVLLLSNTNQEVVWLYVTVKEVTRVHELNSLKLLKR